MFTQSIHCVQSIKKMENRLLLDSYSEAVFFIKEKPGLFCLPSQFRAHRSNNLKQCPIASHFSFQTLTCKRAKKLIQDSLLTPHIQQCTQRLAFSKDLTDQEGTAQPPIASQLTPIHPSKHSLFLSIHSSFCVQWCWEFLCSHFGFFSMRCPANVTKSQKGSSGPTY